MPITQGSGVYPASYAGAEQAMCTRWIKDRLAERSSELEQIANGLADRVYEDLAPSDADYPFIVITCQSPPRDVRGVGTIRVMVDTLYVVKAVSQGTSYDPLVPVAREIDLAMTTAVGSQIGSGFVLTSVRQEQHSRTTVEDGVQFRHLGGEYKMQAQAEQ